MEQLEPPGDDAFDILEESLLPHDEANLNPQTPQTATHNQELREGDEERKTKNAYYERNLQEEDLFFGGITTLRAESGAALVQQLTPEQLKYIMQRLASSTKLRTNFRIDPDDIVNETLLGIMQRKTPISFDSARHFISFLYAVQKNKINDNFRKSTRDKSDPTINTKIDEEIEERLRDQTPSPDKVLTDRDNYLNLVRLINDNVTDPKHRRLIFLDIYGVFSREELAEMFNLSPEALRIQIFRIRNKIKKALRNNPDYKISE